MHGHPGSRRTQQPTGGKPGRRPARCLARALRTGGKLEPIFVESIADMPAAIMNMARDGDVVLTMGAGSISGVPQQLTTAKA